MVDDNYEDYYDDDDVPDLVEDQHVIAPVSSSTTSARVPLTVICGFLGAGKSTLLKRILTERHGYRIAVIMNEFGDTADVESRTINVSSADDPTAEKSEEILELANGCLCCSIKDTGVAAIEKLMQRKGAFDHILLETTGLADPGPIASIFWHNEEFATGLGRDISLDGVVCVVDAVFGQQQMEEDHSTDPGSIGESLRQIAGSDVILLNKTDLVTPEQLAHTERLVHQINPAAPVHRTVRANVDIKFIMNISAYTSPPQVQPSADHDHEHCRDPDHNHSSTSNNGPTHYESRGISSLQVPCPPLDQAQFDKLDEWIRTVLWENHIPGGNSSDRLQVLRCKGLLPRVSGEQYVLQGVRNMYEIEKLEGQEDITISHEGKVVLIGKGLVESVRRSLEAVIQG